MLRDTLEADLQRVADARLRDLRTIWWEKLDQEPPPLRSPEIFRRMLAYRLQAAVFGDLSPAAKRKLTAIEARRANPPKKRAAPPVRLGAGAVLIREWKGVRHEVRVAGSGFEHEGTHYKSLSEVARAITGSRWNGPLFFGLRDKPKAVA
ncbi:DUF2924 domain-containing protein [Phenylobacterium sp.]|uniref:DUF2924 domain-containing protein n=1 Tax=Phenylobacterium sp. TaxID=1871053 RepID=UPI0025F53FBE|nr:DUF2924 domain-containing protein [Phenylobacterium sp.]MBX3483094.1 DUF2924 domain-containing protein [Phenylobacterium sp.]MCW5758440.1 DUF2924 domain-containing protein [Phenylobacterium sp.]